jgi:transposase
MPMLPPEKDVEAGAAPDGGRRPTIVAAPASTSPELSSRPRRRTFTARDKLRILAATDSAAETGGIGAILRREGVYSSTLCDWRRQRDANTYGALTPVKRGPKTAEPNPLTAENTSLRKDNDHLTRCLARAEAIIAVQKKLADLLGIPMTPDGGVP